MLLFEEEFSMQTLVQISSHEQTRLHDASMAILRDVGVAFHNPQAVALFRKHGIKVSGNIVFPDERTVMSAVENAPAEFTLLARNPARSVKIGGQATVLAPGYGAPFIVTLNGEQREATLNDYVTFCKLIQTSTCLNMNGYLMVEPADVAPRTAHLDMLLANITLCDKPFMGSPSSRETALEAIEMADIIWGRKDRSVMLSNINSLAPLQFANEMAAALMTFAAYNQPVIVMGGGMMGSTSPMQIPGLIAIGNAVVLAGITLAQLTRPGTPVVYGVGGGPLDMRTGAYYLSGPESLQVLVAGAQMARFYGLPSRGGGALTDSHCTDMQAGYEAALSMSTALRSGINFILHTAGTLGTFISMSFEKFVIDEDLCATLLTSLTPFTVSDATIDLPTIREVGVGGEYLTHPKTLELCRNAFFQSALSRPAPYQKWKDSGKQRLEQRGDARVAERLEQYVKPDIDPNLEKALRQYVAGKK
jgi:trimethylamine--corrinoid protein Co-methyltransferase